MTQENFTEATPVPEEVTTFAEEHKPILAYLNAAAAIEKPSKIPNVADVQSYIQAVAKPLKDSVMLITASGESLLLFHSEQERKTAYDALNRLPSLVREASHVVYNHKEPKTAMVDGKVYALKIGAALTVELAGLNLKGSLHLPTKQTDSEAQLVDAYRDFARTIVPQMGVQR